MLALYTDKGVAPVGESQKEHIVTYASAKYK